MKIIIKICTLLLIVVLCDQCKKGIELAGINDEYFLNALLDLGVDGDRDGQISSFEAQQIPELILDYDSISDMKGIEAFINLKTLSCKGNKIVKLDVSNNTALTILQCYMNKITSLDVTNNAALETLWCCINALSYLDVSNNTLLADLNCAFNQLITLDVSNNTALKYLSCFNNQLTSLDVSKNTSLENLACAFNQLIILDVSKNTALKRFGCSSNMLTTLDISANTSLKQLYLESMPSLNKVCVWVFALSTCRGHCRIIRKPQCRVYPVSIINRTCHGFCILLLHTRQLCNW